MDYLIQSPGQIARHLRALRRARGLSQAQLGAMLGVGQTRIARIERDPTVISVAQLLGVLGALGVQIVLRPIGDGKTPPPGAARATARAKRPPVDEPW